MIKPQTPRPRINWNNPLSRGLIAVFACNEGAGSLLNLVDMTTKLSLINSGAWTKARIGLALDCSQANDSGAQNTTVPSSMKPTKQVSVMWQGLVLSGPSNSSTFVDVTYNNDNNAPFVGYELGVSGSNFAQLDFNADGTFTFVESSDNSWDGTERQYLGTIKSGEQILYKNGLSIASATNSYTTINYGVSPALNIGLFNSTIGRNNKSKCSLCYIWNRALSSKEATSLYINPLQILFKPKTNLLFSSN